jgi:phosphoglycerate kinase
VSKKTVRDIDVSGKRVLLRVDFNVPANDAREITDDSRIRLALPTINYLRQHGAAIIVCSHFGRPAGKVMEQYRLTAVRKRLGELLGLTVIDAGGPSGQWPAKVAAGLRPGQVAMLENLRFDPGEETNDPKFALSLASLASVYVDDAFGAAHRAHASITGVAKHLPAVAGLLMEKELEMLGAVLSSAKRPAVAIIGGAKVADKIQVLTNLAPKMDTLLIGGGMVSAFLRAKGLGGGKAEVTTAETEAAKHLMAAGKPVVLLPADVVTGDKFAENAKAVETRSDRVPPDALVLDIGHQAQKAFAAEIAKAKLIVWNGPVGVFEWHHFADGTRAVAEAIAANRDATTVVGGGSTAEVVEKLGIRDKFTHVSTGGGASLEFLEGKTLPGVAVLLDK